MTEVIEDLYPDTEPLAQRTTARETIPRSELYDEMMDPLTDRQRAALEASYFAGYIGWPRTSTGREVAGMLGFHSRRSRSTCGRPTESSSRRSTTIGDDRIVRSVGSFDSSIGIECPLREPDGRVVRPRKNDSGRCYGSHQSGSASTRSIDTTVAFPQS